MNISYPYLPVGKVIKYVPEDNQYMIHAKEYARNHSLDKVMPNSSVIVLSNKIIAVGANGSDYHDKHGCRRVELGITTGQGYELCEGCHPKNHGEIQALNNAAENNVDVKGADLYLWGHWWCCRPCWDKMIAAGIKEVYLLENSQVLFNKSAEGNIVGRQFTA